MLRRAWILLLVAGLVVSAHPAGSRIKRLWLQWTAAAAWDACKGESATGQPGESIAWLKIPSAQINQLVVRGVGAEELSRYPGQTAIGHATLIMAHRDTHFRGLAKLGEGDEVCLCLRGGARLTYRVQLIQICDKDDAMGFIQAQSGKECLLLVTCYPFHYIGPAPDRFVAVAVRA